MDHGIGQRRRPYAGLSGRFVLSVVLITALVAPAANAAGALPRTAVVRAVDTGAEAAFLNATNARRAAEGVAPLVVDPRLVGPARQWSQEMADVGKISHRSNGRLKAEAPSEWVVIGENVGTGPEVGLIEIAFENSPPHLRNIVDGRFTHVGFGVVAQADTLWITAYFMAYSVQPDLPVVDPVADPAPVPSPAETTVPRSKVPNSAPETTAPTLAPTEPEATTTTGLATPLPRLANFNPTVTRPIRAAARRGGPRVAFLSLHGIGV